MVQGSYTYALLIKQSPCLWFTGQTHEVARVQRRSTRVSYALTRYKGLVGTYSRDCNNSPCLSVNTTSYLDKGQVAIVSATIRRSNH